MLLNETNMKKLTEGMDIDRITKTVSYNPYEEVNIVTGNDKKYPFPIRGIYTDKTTGKKYKVVSIFRRLKNDENDDGNPIIYAWKNEKRWKFKSENDKKLLIRQFKLITSELNEKFDTIIFIPSTNKMNEEIGSILCDMIPHKHYIHDYILKMEKSQVADSVDVQRLLNDGIDVNTFFQKLGEWMDSMPTEYFQYHYVPINYRKYFSNEFVVPSENVLEYAKFVNNKRVLVIDDTISTVKSISDYCRAVTESFAPKELIIFTAFFSTNRKVIREIKTS